MTDFNEKVEMLYKFIEIKGGKRIEKFNTPDIRRALRFHKWYVARYRTGLLMEIVQKKKKYDWKEKKVTYGFE